MEPDSEESEAEKKEKKEYSSSTQKFLEVYYTPELLSNQGRITVLVIWALLTIFSVYGIR